MYSDQTRPMVFVTRPGRVVVRERPLPALKDYGVRIKVQACALCGSDLHIFRGKHPSVNLPVPVGHEIAGEVVALGERVKRVEIGDRVTVEPVIVCGLCHYCQRGDYHLCANISFQYRQGQGGLTTDFVAHERWVHRLPEGLSSAAGALIEPLAVAVHAVRLADLNPGGSAAIFGAGPIGLLLLQAAQAMVAGNVYISDLRDIRLDAARSLGASAAFNPANTDVVQEIMDCTNGLGVQRSFEAVGLQETLHQSLACLQKGGKAVLVGLFESESVQVPPNLFVQKEISLTGSQGYHWDFQRAIELVEQGRVDLEKLVTHQFPLSQVQQAFQLLQDPQQDTIKIVITNS